MLDRVDWLFKGGLKNGAGPDDDEGEKWITGSSST